MSDQAETSPGYRWGVLLIIMLGTFMAILDASIVNVALPHMMSTFAVNRNRIEWVTTGFMLATAISMPLMGWLAGRMNYKTLYLGCLLLFTVASGLCAMAWSFEAMVAARVLQAVGGGAIQPIGMSIVAELFEPHERGRALGIWGTGIMVAPALGPSLGGYLTDTFSWRAIFSVNLPVGALTLILGMFLMRSLRSTGRKRPFDAVGYALLSVALLAGLTALSEGQMEGWDSTYIHTCEIVSVAALILFVGVELTVRHPLLDLKLFLLHNYSLSMVLAVFRAVGLFGGVFLFPILLQTLMGYTTIQTGFWMMPGAISVGVAMPIAGRLADRYGPRALTFIGTVMVGVSLIQFGQLDPLSGWPVLIIPQVIRGAGLALMMAPLLAAALNAVPREELPMASSFLNVAQRVGGAMGIALLNNYVTRSAHVHAVRIAEGIPPQSPVYTRFALHASRLHLHQTPGVLAEARLKAAFAATGHISRSAQMLSFDNGFVLAGILLMLGLPLCLFLKRDAPRPPAPPA